MTKSTLPTLRSKYILLFLFLTIAGLLFLIFSLSIDEQKIFSSDFLTQISMALLVTGLIGTAYEALLRSDLVKLTRDNAKCFTNISEEKYRGLYEEAIKFRKEAQALGETFEETNRKSVKELQHKFEEISQKNTDRLLNKLNLTQQEIIGLEEVEAEANSYDYSELILNSKNLFLVLNDGRTWLSNRNSLFRKRFEDPEKTTTLFITHPESTMLSVLARREGEKTTERIQGKIEQTVRLLHRIKLQDTKLEIYGHFLYNPYSLFLGDNTAIITPYFFSRVKRTLPVLKFKDSGDARCYYQEARRDLEDLRQDSKDISQYFVESDNQSDSSANS